MVMGAVIRHAEPDRDFIQKQHLACRLPRCAQIVARAEHQLIASGGKGLALQHRRIGAAIGIGALLKSAGLAASSGEGNRLIDGGGVRIDSNVVSDKGLKLGAGTYVLQVGKRKFARVTLA